MPVSVPVRAWDATPPKLGDPSDLATRRLARPARCRADQRLGDAGAAVGVDGRAGAGLADRDIDGRGVHRVGPERLQVGHDAIGGRPLCAVGGADPTRGGHGDRRAS